MLVCHCIAHRFALACEEAAKGNMLAQYVECNMHSIINYFSHSSKRREHLACIQKALRVLTFVVLNLVATRWLSRGNALERIHVNLRPLYVMFKEDAEPPATVVTAVALVALFSSYKFILSATIFRDILSRLNIVSKCFQKDHVKYSDVREVIDAAKEGFKTEYLSKSDNGESML